MGRVVLVTGVSRHLGGRVAARLSAEPGVKRVIGVDVVVPPHDIGGAAFVRADIRNPMIGRIIERDGVDTVVHMSVIATPRGAGGRVSMKEINVIGTMQLLAACQRSAVLRRLVVKSTSAVYGSSPRDPAMFSEDMVGKGLPRGGWGKDSLEVEGYVRGFSRRRPDVDVVTLRLASIVGPGIRTPMTDYFALPVLPTVLGFDARLQFLHEDDAVEALRLATLGEATGVINVAGDGVLTVGQAARIAGRPTVPVPRQLGGALRRVYRRGIADFSPDQLRYLSYGRGLDTRRMRKELGLEPRFSTREAFENMVAARGLEGPLCQPRVRRVERGVLRLLGADPTGSNGAAGPARAAGALDGSPVPGGARGPAGSGGAAGRAGPAGAAGSPGRGIG